MVSALDVTLVYRGPNLLRGFDEDVRSHVAGELKKRGLRVVLACQHERIEKRADGVLVSHVTGDMALESEVVMFATGREPYVEGLGLEAAGVELNAKGAVQVDDYSNTNVDNIWAVGDVTDRINLTPVAIREGQAFAETEFYGRPMSFDHKDVATAVFSPAAGGFGGPDRGGGPPSIGQGRCLPLPLSAHEVRLHERRRERPDEAGGGMRDRARARLPYRRSRRAGDVQMAAIAVKAGLTKQQWDDTCALHPTVAEELVTMREKFTPAELAAAE